LHFWGVPRAHHGTVAGHQTRISFVRTGHTAYFPSPVVSTLRGLVSWCLHARLRAKAVRVVEDISGHNVCKDAAIANPLPPRLGWVLNRVSLAGAGALWALLRI
jgi:hypothetical protein